MRERPMRPTTVKTPTTAPVFWRNGVPPLPTVLVGLTTFLEAVTTNVIEVEVTTKPGVVLLEELDLVVEVVVVGLVVGVVLDVGELREEDEEEVVDVGEVLELVLDRVTESGILELEVVEVELVVVDGSRSVTWDIVKRA
jgi:hypothetical protein